MVIPTLNFMISQKFKINKVSQTQRRFLKIMSIGIQPIVLNIQYDTYLVNPLYKQMIS